MRCLRGRFHFIFGVVLLCGVLPSAANDFKSSSQALYVVQPDVAHCSSGTMSDATRQSVLDTLNDIRRLHGLSAVKYDAESEAQEMQIALMMAANGQESHSPPASWKCFTKAGAEAAGQSNLYGGLVDPNLNFMSPQEEVIGWLTDANNAFANNVGHRRWLLDPFLTRVAYGKVAGVYDGDNFTDGSAIRVIYPFGSETANVTADMVAYPDGDYPNRYFDKRALLSFVVIADKTEKYANGDVDFSAAKISVTERGGARLDIKDVAYDNAGYGLPNNLQFRASSIKPYIVYDVAITGVKVNQQLRDYQYWFRIVK
ncbi:MAG: CAP domain-containing protein [Sideroxydans sp.]|nr:CAP domain-containing protein [Sideroxydans sp.]